MTTAHDPTDDDAVERVLRERQTHAAGISRFGSRRRPPAAPARRPDVRRRRHRRRAVRPRGPRGAAPRRRALDRARGRHRGRVPAAAPRERRAHRRLLAGLPRRRRELDARARRPRRDRGRRRARRRAAAPSASRPQHLPRPRQGRRSCAHIVAALGADTVIADTELAPSQRRALEDVGEGQGHRPHRRDPRHLQPARQEPRGQGAGRARAARVPAAAPARLGRVDVPPGRWPGRRRGRRHGLARTR